MIPLRTLSVNAPLYTTSTRPTITGQIRPAANGEIISLALTDSAGVRQTWSVPTMSDGSYSLPTSVFSSGFALALGAYTVVASTGGGHGGHITARGGGFIVSILPPELESATTNGATISLGYNQALDPASTPPTNAYAVMVDNTPCPVTSVTLNNQSITLGLACTIYQGQIISLSYAAPTTNAAQNQAGLRAADLSGRNVSNASTIAPPHPPAPTVPTVPTVPTGTTLEARLFDAFMQIKQDIKALSDRITALGG